jgi:hemerythrin-like domain-containing protein
MSLGPIEQLMSEHQLIKQVLTALEERLHQVPFPADFIADALDFFSQFADGLHHYKEEMGLFPAMVQNGVPLENGPVACMLHEHDEGRGYLKTIRESLPAVRGGSTEAQTRIQLNAAAYIEMLRNHIWKEDEILFQIALRILPEAAMKELEAKFSDPSNAKIAPEVHARYEAFVQSLKVSA